jgi:galactose mutarotase-like enzyme
MVTQSVGGARIEIDLDAGCRLASLQAGGHELLVTSAPSPIDWGCYPMAPYAGRVRDGCFTFRGRGYELRADGIRGSAGPSLAGRRCSSSTPASCANGTPPASPR